MNNDDRVRLQHMLEAASVVELRRVLAGVD
jgi:hypothetical protein